MTSSWNRFKYTFANGAGALIHYADRFCTILYLAGAGYVGGMLMWMAFAESLWLLLLAVPMLATTMLFLLSYLRNPSLGLRIEWPILSRTRTLKIIHKKGSHPTS